MTSVKPILSDIFMEGKHSWITLEESNDIFQWVPFKTLIFPILFTPM